MRNTSKTTKTTTKKNTHPQRGIQRALAQRRHPPPSFEPAHEADGGLFVAAALSFFPLLPSCSSVAVFIAVAERESHGARPPVLVHEQPRPDLPAEDAEPPPPLVVDGDAPRAEELVAAKDLPVGDGHDRREDLVVVRGGEDREDLVVGEVDAGVGLDL